jgi:hypothetical protein
VDSLCYFNDLLLLSPLEQDQKDPSDNHLPHKTLSRLLPPPEEESGKLAHLLIAEKYEAFRPP